MRARRVDENQADIVSDLRDLGYTVAITSGCGDGFPDIVVGGHGRNWLFEIKDPNKPKADQALTSAQRTFFEDWKGQANVIRSVDDALKVMRDGW